MNLPAWVEDYRGRPFLRGAAGPAAFDCYGLCRAVLRDRWSVDAPALDDVHLEDVEGRLRAATEADGAFWEEVDDAPREGDVVAFMDPGPRHELHVGIVIAPGWMLHARQGEGVATGRFDRLPWSGLRVGGVFRPIGRSAARSRRPRSRTSARRPRART